MSASLELTDAISPIEVEADELAEQRFAECEAHLATSRRRLMEQLNGVHARAKELQTELAQTTESEATARLTGALEDLQYDTDSIWAGLCALVAEALGTVHDDDSLTWEYYPSEVEGWVRRAVEMTGIRPTFTAALLSDLVRIRKVPNARFRERYLALLDDTDENAPTTSSITLAVHARLKDLEVANGGSYGAKNLVAPSTRQEAHPQVRTLERWLGIQTQSAGQNESSYLRLFITYEQAVALSRALGMSPSEAGV